VTISVRTRLTGQVGEAVEKEEQPAQRGPSSLSRRSGGRLFESSTTPAEVKRPLLTPDEVLRLPADDALLFLSGRPPVRATRARFYEDRELLRRSQIPPAPLSRPLRGIRGTNDLLTNKLQSA